MGTYNKFSRAIDDAVHGILLMIVLGIVLFLLIFSIALVYRIIDDSLIDTRITACMHNYRGPSDIEKDLQCIKTIRG